LGAGSKAGLVPLHVWLPLAHPAAPSHVSASMSGVMTKVAIYGFIGSPFNSTARPHHPARTALRAAEHCFGHRLMMDRIVPGGVTADLRPDGHAAITGLVATIRRHFPALVELYDRTASRQNCTVSTGILRPELALQYGAGGFIGRASARAFDARKLPGYAPYPDLTFEVAVRQAGDVDARVWVRIEEVQQSLSLIEQILQGDHEGALRIETPAHIAGDGCEGLALVEGFRGDILSWVRLAPNGRLARCHLRDPSWLQWSLLEAAIEGNIVADFPLCKKSFNCSYSGHDL
jgi:Ni,Fe-hydrogenase III large subunit